MAQAQQAGQFNRENPSKPKKNRFAHTANTAYGMGTNQGLGLKPKVGRVIRGEGANPVPQKKIGKPPKSLA
jgi:hypothetical protein